MMRERNNTTQDAENEMFGLKKLKTTQENGGETPISCFLEHTSSLRLRKRKQKYHKGKQAQALLGTNGEHQINQWRHNKEIEMKQSDK
jgi:hypothetical protein